MTLVGGMSKLVTVSACLLSTFGLEIICEESPLPSGFGIGIVIGVGTLLRGANTACLQDKVSC